MRRLAARGLARLRGPGAWRTWLALGLLGAITAYALYRILQYDLRELDLGALIGRLSLPLLGLTLAIYAVMVWLSVLGWGLILGGLSGFWGWLDHTRIYCVAQVARRLPGTYWYMLGRVMMYERLGVGRGVTTLAGGVELAITCVGGLLVMLVTWPLVLGARSASPLWFVLALLVLAALLNPPAVRWIVRKLSPHSPAVRYRHIMLWSLIYALIWVLGGLILFTIADAVYPALTVEALPALVGIWATAGMAAMTLFSFLPFGLGAAELTIAALMGGLLPPAEALFVAFALRAVLTIAELIFGLFGLSLGLPGLIHPPSAGTPAQEADPLPGAEKPEGLLDTQGR